MIRKISNYLVLLFLLCCFGGLFHVSAMGLLAKVDRYLEFPNWLSTGVVVFAILHALFLFTIQKEARICSSRVTAKQEKVVRTCVAFFAWIAAVVAATIAYNLAVLSPFSWQPYALVLLVVGIFFFFFGHYQRPVRKKA